MKILIVARSASRTAWELAGYCREAFASFGMETELFDYAARGTRIPLLGRIGEAAAGNRLLRRAGTFRPDAVLIVKGDRIPPGVLKALRRNGKTVIANYWIDDPHYFGVSSRLSPHYDVFFTNAQECVEKHRAAGCPHPRFLSFGCAPAVHRPVPLTDDERARYGSDICFCGTMDERRLRVLESVADLGLRIWSPPFFNRFKEGYDIERTPVPAASPAYPRCTGASVWGEELVKVYSAARIVLNIHSPQQAPVMRDFEAAGCGAFLLSDPVPGLDAFFTPGREIECFSDTAELRAKIVHYLEHGTERRAMGERARERAAREHTYAARMREALESLSNG